MDTFFIKHQVIIFKDILLILNELTASVKL